MNRFSFNKWKAVYFLCMVFILGSTNAQFNNECRTPNEEDGICIVIEECPKLLALLKFHKHEKSVLTLLQKSICGFRGKIPKVCCPLDSLFASTPEPRSNTETPEKNFTSPKLPLQMECGQVNVSQSRIYGGTRSDLGSWPWIAALGYQSVSNSNNNSKPSWLCGGTLITNSHVLTAAHCVTGIGYLRVSVVRLGELDLNPNVDDGATPLDVSIDRIIVHDRYNARGFTNDIALLKLKSSVTYTQFIQPICLPILLDMNNIGLEGSMSFVAGWGSTQIKNNESPTTTLIEVQVPITSTEECKHSYRKHNFIIDNRVICAGYPDGGRDSCRGDSGGPLMWLKRGQFYLLGIVSYGYKKCGEPGYPGVYTSVPAFLDWIVENLNND